MKLMKFLMMAFLVEMTLGMVFMVGLGISARMRLGHAPSDLEWKCEGRRVFEAFGHGQNWTDDLGCGK